MRALTGSNCLSPKCGMQKRACGRLASPTAAVAPSERGVALTSVQLTRPSREEAVVLATRREHSELFQLFTALCITAVFLLPAGTADGAEAVAVGSVAQVLSLSASKAFKGGVAGSAAGVLQVLVFCWLRTAMNVQQKEGGGLQETLRRLFAEGGIPRLYSGVGIALIQAPLSRFGDTAANTGALAVCAAFLPGLSTAGATAVGSAAGALWRILLTPLDALKTTRQVGGAAAGELLRGKVRERGLLSLFDGSLANFAASWVGSFPFFYVLGSLQSAVPSADGALSLVRNAAIGCCASAVSDTCSNSLRVLKTIRQTSVSESYVAAAARVIGEDGVLGFLGRGLGTRLLVNVLQGALFNVVWESLKTRLQ